MAQLLVSAAGAAIGGWLGAGSGGTIFGSTTFDFLGITGSQLGFFGGPAIGGTYTPSSLSTDLVQHVVIEHLAIS